MRRGLRIVLAATLVTGIARCRSDQAIGVPGTPSRIAVLAGDTQQGEVGLALPVAPSVTVRDAAGRPVPDASVIWIVLSGGGSLSAPTSITDVDGHTSVTWVLGNTVGAGAQTLRARIGNTEAFVEFTATGVLSAGQLGVQSGDGQIGAAAAPLLSPIAVFVKTLAGAPVAGVTVSWRVTSGGGNLSLAASKTDGLGVARVTWTLGPGAGTNAVEAAASGLSPTTIAFSARGLVAPASAITGAITTSNGFLAPPPLAPLRVIGTAGPVEYTPRDLIVTLRAAALAAPPLGSRALEAAATARTVAAAVWKRAASWEAGGRVKVTGVSPVVLATRLRVTDTTKLDSVAATLRRDPDVARVTRDQWLHAHGRPAAVQNVGGTIPSDPNYPNQSWHYVMIDLPRAWSITTGSASVLVAVVDNGIRFDHPAIAANLTHDGYDFVSMRPDSVCGLNSPIDNAEDGDGYDPDPTIPDDWDSNPEGTCLQQRSRFGGHGLHVAGTIGAVGNDGIGPTGVNWSVSIRPVRVLGPAGGSSFDVAQGILYAAGLPASDGNIGTVQAPSGARIINLSLGGPCDLGAEVAHDAVIAATNAGALVAASAGNDATSSPSCPASFPEVVSVTAVGPNGMRASYANFGPTVDIAAPGGDFVGDGTFGVFSTTCDFTTSPCTPNQARYTGTSMAAPHVSGVAALLLAVAPSLTVEDLRSRLTAYVGAGGIVNARNSLTQTLTPPVQMYVRVFDAATGQAVATQPVGADGVFTVSGLADGSYYVFAGEDESGDGRVGVPGRRWGALGGTATPQAVTVTASAGATAFFPVGFANEAEPNPAFTTTNRLFVGGYLQGDLTPGDADVYRVVIPTAGQYSFETSGEGGAFCRFALTVNTVLALYDANGSPLGQNDDVDAGGNNFCSRISMTLGAGAYFVGVTPGPNFLGGTHSGRYRVEARAGP